MTQTAKDEAERIATPGAVTWHSSEEDAGPDVGIEIGIGGDSTLWVGEVSDRLLEEQKIDANKFGGSCGWWLIHYREKESQVFGKFADAEIARSFADLIADALRSARAEALEEAAKIAESRVPLWEEAEAIATAIRALAKKDRPHD